MGVEEEGRELDVVISSVDFCFNQTDIYRHPLHSGHNSSLPRSLLHVPITFSNNDQCYVARLNQGRSQENEC